MDRATIERNLAQVERDLRAASEDIAQQQETLRNLVRHGEDATEAVRSIGIRIRPQSGGRAMNDNDPTVAQRIALLKDAAEKMQREADEAEMQLLRTPTDERLGERVVALRKLADDALDKIEELREENS